MSRLDEHFSPEEMGKFYSKDYHDKVKRLSLLKKKFTDSLHWKQLNMLNEILELAGSLQDEWTDSVIKGLFK